MLTLNNLSALSALSALRSLIHDIRLTCAVYHIETERFGPDMRENLTIADSGKILTNLFQSGTATVSHNGTVAVVRSRSAARAAACLALRLCRSGTVPMGPMAVCQKNRRGQSQNETFEFVPIQDGLNGDERANIDRLTMGHYSTKRIDDVSFPSEPARRASLSPMTAEERSIGNWRNSTAAAAARPEILAIRAVDAAERWADAARSARRGA